MKIHTGHLQMKANVQRYTICLLVRQHLCVSKYSCKWRNGNNFFALLLSPLSLFDTYGITLHPSDLNSIHPRCAADTTARTNIHSISFWSNFFPYSFKIFIFLVFCLLVVILFLLNFFYTQFFWTKYTLLIANCYQWEISRKYPIVVEGSLIF